jgi:sugar phosphate isomerase/epimerase
MDCLLSLNWKFYEAFDTAHALFSYLNRYPSATSIAGCELLINPSDPTEQKFVTAFVSHFSSVGWILQIHAPNLLEEYDWESMLEYYDKLRQITGQSVLPVVVHPLLAESGECAESLTQTFDFLAKFIRIVRDKKYHISFLLENLDTLHGKRRIGLHALHTACFVESVGFCWDIGHELKETNQIGNLNTTLQRRLQNIHLHGDRGNGHGSLVSLSVPLETIASTIHTFHYDGSIVLEVALENLPGNTVYEKIDAYIKECQLLNGFL